MRIKWDSACSMLTFTECWHLPGTVLSITCVLFCLYVLIYNRTSVIVYIFTDEEPMHRDICNLHSWQRADKQMLHTNWLQSPCAQPKMIVFLCYTTYHIVHCLPHVSNISYCWCFVIIHKVDILYHFVMGNEFGAWGNIFAKIL